MAIDESEERKRGSVCWVKAIPSHVILSRIRNSNVICFLSHKTKLRHEKLLATKCHEMLGLYDLYVFLLFLLHLIYIYIIYIYICVCVSGISLSLVCFQLKWSYRSEKHGNTNNKTGIQPICQYVAKKKKYIKYFKIPTILTINKL
jgi:hypothetical protein